MLSSTIMLDLSSGRAVGLKGAASAIGASGVADAAAVPDELVAELGPFLARDLLHQIALDLHRISLAREAQALREARDVRVDHHAVVDAEGGAEHHVGGLAR